MKTLFLHLCFALALCAPTLASEPELLAGTSWHVVVPDVAPVIKQDEPKTTPKRGLDWKLVIAGASLQAATIVDLRSTYATLNRCASCVEGNPFLRPIINKPVLAYAVTGGINAGIIYSMKRLKDSGKWYWFAPAVVGTAIHLLAANHNKGIR